MKVNQAVLANKLIVLKEMIILLVDFQIIHSTYIRETRRYYRLDREKKLVGLLK